MTRQSNSPDPVNVLRLSANISHCLTNDCSSVENLGFADLGTALKGRDVMLLIQWDPAGNQFMVQSGTNAPISLPYMVADGEPPSRDFKGLEIVPIVPNCTTDPRPVGNMTVRFDNAFVNESAVGGNALQNGVNKSLDPTDTASTLPGG